uniref:PSP proline-rich domain-containing protein n=1 Tax=Strigamia maritima TaxID=126957 RepID=T1ITY7_STRMM
LVIGSEDDPVITIHFRTNEYAIKYKKQIENYVKNLIKQESEEEITEIKHPSDVPFFIDNKARSSKHKSRKYPIYEKEITDVMTDEVVVAAEKVPDDKPRNSCFNCCGDHLLHECPKPIDRQQIMINRKGFFNKFGGRQSRYHADLESQNAKFRPGVISQELQRALNLGENQLPIHIYRMRVLGYPPGWLSDAKVESSGITMFDAHGKAVAAADEVEEGEVADGSIRVQFDPGRLVEYPGFNTYPQSGVVDDFEALGFPPIQEHHLKSTFIRRMKPPQATPFKRKCETELAGNHKKPRIEVDMDIDETAPEETNFLPTEDEEISNPCSPIAVSIDEDGLSSENAPECPRAPSPSLEELEKQKNQLMEQLDSADSCTSQSTSSTCTLVTSPQVTHSKCVSLGTPIPEASSPYSNLPDASKFSATITEHLNFENLPDTTGNFDKMKVLLAKIRRRSLE